MPEPQAVTPAAAPAPVPDAFDASINALAAAASDGMGIEPEPTEPAPPPAPTEKPKEEGEKPADAPPPPAAAGWDPNQEFTEEELATPEGIQAAAAKIRGGLQEYRQKVVALDGRFAKFKAKEERQKATFSRWEEEHERNNAATRQIFSTVEALRKGDTETALRALGTLTGKDPLAALEELSTAIATNGKGHARSPTETALQERIDALEARLEQDKQSWAQQQRIAALTQEAHAIQAHITPEKYPVLARFHAADPESTLRDLLDTTLAYEERTGQRVDYNAFLSFTEKQLAEKFGFAVSTGNGTQTPSVAQSTPAESLSPSLAAHGGTARAKTAEELEAEAEALIPESWVRAGRGG